MKIQLKRSSVLDGGTAKAPLAEQMEYGELAINYNASDPSIFIKNSTNDIVKLIGDGSITDDFLKLDASNGPITGALGVNGLLTASSGITSNDLLTAGSGILVSLGGSAATANIYRTGNKYIQFGGNNRTLATFATDINNVGNGATFGDSTCQLSTTESDINLIKAVYQNGGHGGGQNLALINNSVEVDTGAQRVCLYQANSGAQQSGKLFAYWAGLFSTDSTDEVYNFYAQNDAPNYFGGDILTAGSFTNKLPENANNTVLCVNTQANHAGFDVTTTVNFVVGRPANVTGNRQNLVGYEVNSSFGADYTDGNRAAYGFSSNMPAASNGQTYNFYAQGTAPNFFQGNITCNGTVTSTNITSLTAALTAVKAAASDASTDLAGLKAALVTALASF